MADLKKYYEEKVVVSLKDKFGFKSSMRVPKIEKVVLNMGLGEASQNAKSLQIAEYCLVQISGQKPKVCRSKKSIATFKIRAGMPIGLMVTLRGKRMYDFLERFIGVALPRVRDFRGIPETGFDGRGNYTMGLKDQIVFPEIDFEKVDKVRGMDITFVTSARDNNEAHALLSLIGLPFRNKNDNLA
jgi:large subunit ribosomal protein L5